MVTGRGDDVGWDKCTWKIQQARGWKLLGGGGGGIVLEER